MLFPDRKKIWSDWAERQKQYKVGEEKLQKLNRSWENKSEKGTAVRV